MPFVNIKIVKDVLPEGKKKELVAKITDAVVSVYNENFRPHIWVIVDEVEADNWGIGGEPVNIEFPKQLLEEG